MYTMPLICASPLQSWNAKNAKSCNASPRHFGCFFFSLIVPTRSDYLIPNFALFQTLGGLLTHNATFMATKQSLLWSLIGHIILCDTANAPINKCNGQEATLIKICVLRIEALCKCHPTPKMVSIIAMQHGNLWETLFRTNEILIFVFANTNQITIQIWVLIRVWVKI